MIDVGFTKIAILGVIALVVIGPEKLPGVARTLGALLARAKRYVADVQAEVNRSMELDELHKMKQTLQVATREFESSMQTHASEFESNWGEATQWTADTQTADAYVHLSENKQRRKNWRIKIAATPRWYKARHGVRYKALSGAARVARFRPRKSSS